MSYRKIAKEAGCGKSTVYYYMKRPKVLYAKKRSKLSQEYLDYIYRTAANKPLSQISGSYLAEKVNEKLIEDKVFDNKGQQMSISKSQINKILKQMFGGPRKIKKVFYLNEQHKEKRIKFCEKLLKKGIQGKNIFFTDETKIDLSPAIDKIRLTKKKQGELKKGEEQALDLVTVKEKKHEFSIMIAGGISFYGLSDLFLLNGKMNNFAYSQAIDYYKNNFKEFKNKNLFFEQDGARCHTSKKNKNILNKIFPKKWIQNSPHSPDIAYPIETLWAELKKK